MRYGVLDEPRLCGGDRARNVFVKEIQDVLGAEATRAALPALKKACRGYPVLALTMRSRAPDVRAVVGAARTLLDKWDALPAATRHTLSRVMGRPKTPENLRQFARAFLDPQRRRGHPVDWPRKIFIGQVAEAILGADVEVERKHGGNLDHVVKILLRALGEPAHDSLDLRRDLTATIAELKVAADPRVQERSRRPLRADRQKRVHNSRKSAI